MQRKTVRSVALGLAVVLIAGTVIAHPAIQVIDLIWSHIGGKETWAKCRYLEFTWASETDGEIKGTREHTWDRYSGDYVVKYKKGDDAYAIYFNVNSKEGTALKNGSPVGEGENKELVELGHAMFINDSYWLLAPLKLEDPGARVQYTGHVNPDGSGVETGHEGTYIVLHVFFDKPVGLTPGDQYWLHVDHDGALKRWKYELEGGGHGDWLWSEEKDCGMGIKLSTRRETLDGKRAIVFPNIKLSEAMDSGVFEPPTASQL